jgi:formylglycine-generating enzyme required for sulfatase activity
VGVIVLGWRSADVSKPADAGAVALASPPAAKPPQQLNAAAPPGPAPEGMAWVPGGKFWMGDNDFPDALPEHLVEVDGFWMDRHEVTNAEFAKFVEATGSKTIAPRFRRRI